MSTRISLEGLWIGCLCYDGPDWEDDPLRDTVAKFELKIEQKDDQYPATYCEEGFAAVATRCILEGHELTFMIPDLERIDVCEERQRASRFTAEFDPTTGRFAGEWEIGEVVPEYGPDFLDNISAGSWEMHRG